MFIASSLAGGTAGKLWELQVRPAGCFKASEGTDTSKGTGRPISLLRVFCTCNAVACSYCVLPATDATSSQAWWNRANQSQSETSKSMSPNKPFLSASWFTHLLQWHKDNEGRIRTRELHRKSESYTNLQYYLRTNKETKGNMKGSQSNQMAWREKVPAAKTDNPNLAPRKEESGLPQVVFWCLQVHLTSIHRLWYSCLFPKYKLKTLQSKSQTQETKSSNFSI